MALLILGYLIASVAVAYFIGSCIRIGRGE